MCEELSSFKLVVDIFSSLAALIAIVASLISWYRSARNALRVERVVVHKKASGYVYKLIISNIKNYPVSVFQISGFNSFLYLAEKQQGQLPSIKVTLGSNIFSTEDITEIGAIGEATVRFCGHFLNNIPEYLVIALKTTHGYHQLKCKNITSVEFGTYPISMEYSEKCESRFSSFLFVIRQYLK